MLYPQPSHHPKVNDMLARLLYAFPLLVAFGSAFAEATGADAPVERASPVTVALFLVLFLGSCVFHVAFTWWRGRHQKPPANDE